MSRVVQQFLLAATLVIGASIAAPNALAEVASQHYDGVLGTSMDLSIAGVDDAVAEAAFDAALTEVSRLDVLLSEYRSDSEVSRLNQQRSLTSVSTELRELINYCRHWESETRGRFSCKMGQIRDRWRAAETSGELPDRRELRGLARQLRSIELPNADTDTYTLPQHVNLDLGGIAKGFIIDQVLAAMQQAAPTAVGIKVDIGGDARYHGTNIDGEPWLVGLSDTFSDESAPNGVVALRGLALAASGHQSRTYVVGRREYSQILSARDGWPTPNKNSSYVLATSALAADVAATLTASADSADALDWVSGQALTEVLLVLPDGRQAASENWRSFEVLDHDSPLPLMTVSFEIPEIEEGRYRRPYVAVWITNSEREPIRNLLLLGESRRWAQENRRWWRAVGRDNRVLFDGYARSTRRPGSYTVSWDGRDDQGRPVEGEQFWLHMEAAREHGGHTYTNVKLDFSAPASESLAAEGEFGDISIRWERDSTPSSQGAVAATNFFQDQ
ncbi:MAG: DUF2271 domain-containing protein [Pseudomonadota bacterium]